MTEIKSNDPVEVVDMRIPPFVSLPKTGILAIKTGSLKAHEIGVYVTLSMMTSGYIRLEKDADVAESLSIFTGLTEAEVKSTLLEIERKGLLIIDNDIISFND